MTTVGIRELKDQTSELIRRVEQGEHVAVTNHGRVVARIVPAQATQTEIDQGLAILADLDTHADTLATYAQTDEDDEGRDL